MESYLTTGNLLPWNIKTPMGGNSRIETINGVNPCTSGGTYCAGGSVVIRAFPPSTAGGYVSFVQDFQARPSTRYTASFLYRCLNFDANSAIDVLYAGNKVGGIVCPNLNTAAFQLASGIPFTTDATGRGEIELRFKSSGATPYLYFYADDFKAKVV